MPEVKGESPTSFLILAKHGYLRTDHRGWAQLQTSYPHQNSYGLLLLQPGRKPVTNFPLATLHAYPRAQGSLMEAELWHCEDAVYFACPPARSPASGARGCCWWEREPASSTLWGLVQGERSLEQRAEESQQCLTHTLGQSTRKLKFYQKKKKMTLPKSFGKEVVSLECIHCTYWHNQCGRLLGSVRESSVHLHPVVQQSYLWAFTQKKSVLTSIKWCSRAIILKFIWSCKRPWIAKNLKKNKWETHFPISKLTIRGGIA